MIGCAGGKHPCIEGEFAAVGGDRQGVIDTRINLFRTQSLVTFHQVFLDGLLLLGHRAGDNDGLAGFQPGAGQVDHFCRLHVSEGAEHLLKLRQIHELGEPAAGPQRRAVG